MRVSSFVGDWMAVAVPTSTMRLPSNRSRPPILMSVARSTKSAEAISAASSPFSVPMVPWVSQAASQPSERAAASIFSLAM